MSLPTIRDRVAQMAAVLVLEPIFEADLQPGNTRIEPTAVHWRQWAKCTAGKSHVRFDERDVETEHG
jgi:hypothetical protein